MQVFIDRKWKKETYTIGRVFIDGQFFANSMEDRDRGLHQDMSIDEIKAKKVYGETAIPAGRYRVIMTYSPRFKRRLPLILNVKCFDGVRCHPLNTSKQSEGCIGFGKNDKVGWISDSKATHDRFEKMLEAAGGQCDLEIR